MNDALSTAAVPRMEREAKESREPKGAREAARPHAPARTHRAPRLRRQPALPGIVRFLAALLCTAALLAFLALARWHASRTAPDLTIRTLEVINPVSMPAPPPPPPPTEPPPPPPPEQPPLPKLDIVIDSTAPPIKATLEDDAELDLTMPDFQPAVDKPMENMLFSSKDLDSQPRLVNRPSVTYPASQRARGVHEGKVTLEVTISPSGKVDIRRVIDSDHPDFTSMARSFASRARFTSPKKDGRAVSAVFRWPMVLRP